MSATVRQIGLKKSSVRKAENEKISIFAPGKRGACPSFVLNYCESSSVGRAQPCQGWGRGFESRLSLMQVSLNSG